MVTFQCKNKECSQKDIKIDFMGSITEAECGGCSLILKSFDLRDDPEIIISIDK